MRGTIAMWIPVWPLIRRAAKLGSRLEGELVLEQQEPEHPRGRDALEDRHRSGKPADRPVERKQQEEQEPQHGPGKPADAEVYRRGVALRGRERPDSGRDRGDRHEQAIPPERAAARVEKVVGRDPQVGKGEQQDESEVDSTVIFSTPSSTSCSPSSVMAPVRAGTSHTRLNRRPVFAGSRTHTLPAALATSTAATRSITSSCSASGITSGADLSTGANLRFPL